jgi:DNA-binding MarR family transcriptional regulator
MSRPSADDHGPLLGSLVRLAAQRVQEQHARWLETSGFGDLQPAHSAVIQPLWDHPEGARLTALARASRITKQSMSALVDHVEKRGYVERVPDPHDARASLIRLTARGRTFARAIRGFAREIEADWSERIGRERTEHLRSALESLRESWLADDEE